MQEKIVIKFFKAKTFKENFPNLLVFFSDFFFQARKKLWCFFIESLKLLGKVLGKDDIILIFFYHFAKILHFAKFKIYMTCVKM